MSWGLYDTGLGVTVWAYVTHDTHTHFREGYVACCVACVSSGSDATSDEGAGRLVSTYTESQQRGYMCLMYSGTHAGTQHKVVKNNRVAMDFVKDVSYSAG